MSLKEFADTLPDYAKDIRLNISSLLNDQMLGDQRKYGLLLACAHGTGYQPIVQDTAREVEEKLSDAAKNAARAAAAVKHGRTSCRGRGGRYVWTTVVAVA